MDVQEREYEEAMVSSKGAREAYERFSAQAAEAAREASEAERTKDTKLESKFLLKGVCKLVCSAHANQDKRVGC